jgi:NUMOD4 motif-containing protein
VNREEWRPVTGYEGRYEVSSYGRVRSLDRVSRHSKGGTQKWPGKMLTPSMGWRRGGQVRLYGEGQERKVSVRALVAEAFPELAEKNDAIWRRRTDRPMVVTYDQAMKSLGEAEQAVAWYKAQLAAMPLAHEQLKAQLAETSTPSLAVAA